jgi:hypothetical protein
VWLRFVPFVFVGGGEGRREEFEGPPREKERDVIVLGDGLVCKARVSGRDWEVLRIAKLT